MKLPYKIYLKHRDFLLGAESSQSNLYDKSLLTVAGGALGLSITFMKEISPKPVDGSLGYLAGSWALLTICVAAVLVSMFCSQFGCRRACEILDQEQLAEEGAPISRRNGWITFTAVLNVLSAVAFVIGLALLARFSFLNLAM